MIPRDFIYERPDTISSENPNDAVTEFQLQSLAGIKDYNIEFSSDIFDLLSAQPTNQLFSTTDPTAPPSDVVNPIMNSYYNNPVTITYIGGGGTPGGSDTQVQFNDGGAFGGDVDFTWNKTTNTLTLGENSTIDAPGLYIDGTTGTSIQIDSGTTFTVNSGASSDIVLNGGAGVGDGSIGGDIYASAGGASATSIVGGTLTGGDMVFSAGDTQISGTSSANEAYGGNIIFNAGSTNGSAAAFDGFGGYISLTAADGVSNGSGGDILLSPGNPGSDGTQNGGVFVGNLTATYRWRTGYVNTTNATPTGQTRTSMYCPSGEMVYVEAHVAARRTGGSSGATGDCAGYVRRAVYKNTGAGPTLVGSVQDAFTAESQAGWDCTFTTSGNYVQVQVTGAANNNITWKVITFGTPLSSL